MPSTGPGVLKYASPPLLLAKVTNMKHTLQSGVSLIEVLITMVLVAITLLGLMGIQARSLTYQVDSLNGRAASDLLAQFKERLSANHLSYMNGAATGYSVTVNPSDDPSSVPPPPPACNPCTENDEISQREIALWFAEVRRRLPAPALLMQPLTATSATEGLNITLGWLDSENINNGVATGCEDIATIAQDARYRCITVTVFPG